MMHHGGGGPPRGPPPPGFQQPPPYMMNTPHMRMWGGGGPPPPGLPGHLHPHHQHHHQQPPQHRQQPPQQPPQQQQQQQPPPTSQLQDGNDDNGNEYDDDDGEEDDDEEAALAAALAEEAELEAAFAEEAAMEAGEGGGTAAAAAATAPLSAPPPKPNSFEARCKPFEAFLGELKVSSFAIWDTEKDRLLKDPRALALTPKERKRVFERYTAARVEKEKKKRAKKKRKIKEAFMALLRETKLSIHSRFTDFKAKRYTDKRYKAVEKMKERMSLFDEHISELKEQRRLEKGGAPAKERKQRQKEEFWKLLEEEKVDKDTSWRRLNDSSIYKDKRWAAVRAAEREGYFYDYVDGLGKTAEEAKASESKRRARAALEAREDEVRQSKRFSGRQRDHFRYKEDCSQLALLLVDKIRSVRTSWEQCKSILEADSRYDNIRQAISEGEVEDIFHKHVDVLRGKRQAAWRKLLDSKHDITLATEWDAARALICSEDGFGMFEDDKEREQGFEEYKRSRKSKSVREFNELLAETRSITHTSWKAINAEREAGKMVTMKSILAELSRDARHLELDSFAEERADLLSAYLVDRDRQGTPPPATSSAKA